jgi:hypothetical protein
MFDVAYIAPTHLFRRREHSVSTPPPLIGHLFSKLK